MRILMKGKGLNESLTAWCEWCLAYVPLNKWHTCAGSVLKQGPQRQEKRER